MTFGPPALPGNLRNSLSHPETPWHLNESIFKKLQEQSGGKGLYKRCVITQSDKEWGFIYKYFNYNKPTNFCIKRIQCIHNAGITKRFEADLPGMEEEAQKPIFRPDLGKESHPDLREKVLKRFEEATGQFSPFRLRVNERQTKSFQHAKILPLWHGTSEQVCEGISQTGFTYFGKHQILKGEKDSANTDQGYFGSGIYFTNSARYAAEIYGNGHMMLAWVSLRTPFPVVADKALHPPKKPEDLRMLEGQGAYRNYNAHYIPVISVDPKNKKCAVYYPCATGQEPVWDELVVFQKSQALAQFWVEVMPELLKNPSSMGLKAGFLLDEVLKLLDKESVRETPELAQFLENKTEFLLTLGEHDSVGAEEEAFYRRIQRLLDSSGKVRKAMTRHIMPKEEEKKESKKEDLAVSTFSGMTKGTPTKNKPVATSELFLTPTRKGSIDHRIPIEIACPAVAKKLTNPHLALSIEESIELLTTCVSYGENYVKKIEGKEAIIVIGNTGAGKSTFVNYLSGCTMELKKPKALGLKGTGKIVVVKSTKEGGRYDEIMPIGHTKQSKTFIPQIETAPDKVNTYCDCPGFLDNRGAEINIANAVNVRNALMQSNRVKILVLINYHSLKADRGRGLSEMLKICTNLFGSLETLKRYKESLLLGVTQVPIGGDLDLEDLKEWIVEDTPPIMEVLVNQLFIFDPLERPLDGGWSREECLKQIGSLEGITNPRQIFKTVLNDSDEKKLIEISEEMGKKVAKHLKSTNYPKAAQTFKNLKRLEVIDHISVERLIQQNERRISRELQNITDAFKEHCHFEAFSNAQRLLEELKKAEEHFKGLLTEKVDVEVLNGYYLKSKKQAEARAEQQRYMEEQLQKAQGHIKELMEVLESQKKAMLQEKTEQESKYQKLMIDFEKRLEETQKVFQEEQKALQKETENKLAQKEQDLKLASELNQKALQKELAAEIDSLKKTHQEKLKQAQKEQAEELSKEQAKQKEMKEKLEQEKASYEAKLKQIEATKAQKVQELKELERPKIAFGKAEWAKYFGDVGAEPPLPKEIDKILKSECPYWSGKRVEETHLLVLIPKTVNGQKYSLNLLQDLAKRPQGGGHALKTFRYYSTVGKEMGNNGIQGSYWSLITKDVLPNSRVKSFEEQKPLLKGPHEVPEALELATGILMHHVKTGERLYPDKPDTYSCCQETLIDGERVVVGSFESSGLFIGGYFDYGRNDGCGLGGVRKF